MPIPDEQLEAAAYAEGMKDQRRVSEQALANTLQRSHAPDTAAMILARFRHEELAARQSFLNSSAIAEIL